MKKIINIILTIFLLFSSTNFVKANETYIDGLLNIDYGIEEYKINLIDIDEVSFKDKSINKMFVAFKKVNRTLKSEIIEKYREGKFDYYQVNGIINTHKNFVYYVNRLFYHVGEKERDPSLIDADYAILESYKQVRISYNRLKYLIRNG